METPLAQLQAHIDALSHPAWAFDPNTLQFLAVNAAALELYGYTRKEFLRLTVLDVRPTTEIKRFLGVMREAAFVGSHGEWRHRNRRGEEFDVLIDCEPCWLEGRAARVAYVRSTRPK